MSVENQIEIYADEPEQLSANEVLLLLIEGHCIYIDGELCNLFDVTSKIEAESLTQFAEDSLLNNAGNIREIYIKTIQEMME